MNCLETRSLLDAYLDSELDARSSLGVAEHLAACPRCAAVFRDAERTHRYLENRLQAGERSAALWEQIEAEVATAGEVSRVRPLGALRVSFEEEARSWWFWLWPSPRFYAAVAALWLALAWLQFTLPDADRTRASGVASMPATIRQQVGEQRRLLVELLDLPPAPPARGAALPPRDRSELDTPFRPV